MTLRNGLSLLSRSHGLNLVQNGAVAEGNGRCMLPNKRLLSPLTHHVGVTRTLTCRALDSRLAAGGRLNSFPSSTSFGDVSSNGRRLFSVDRRLYAAIDDEFKSAQERLNTLTEDPGNMVKLQIYALFKQSTIGKCNAKKPGMTDFVGRAKWTAWNDLGGISQDEAKQKYIDLVNSLVKSAAPTESVSVPEGDYKELIVKKENGLMVITKNRPTKKNAINYAMYEELGKALKEGAEDESVVLAAMTGSGDYYCSGNDLGNFMNITPDQMAAHAVKGGDILEEYVNAYIDFPKPLIGVINGPAVGVGVTMLGLFDAVYATNSATFHTPFSALGQSPEACSSDLFPKILGPLKANEVLLFNAKLTAKEASDLGLVTQVFPDDQFQTQVWEKIDGMAKLPKGSLRYSKELIRPEAERNRLKAVNRAECDRLIERWQSAECVNAIMKFFSK